MAGFYQEFKSNVEILGFTAPSPNIGDNLYMVSTSISTAAGIILGMDAPLTAAKFEEVFAGCQWLKYAAGLSPTGTIAMKAFSVQAQAGVASIKAIKMIPRGRLFLNAAVYVGALCIAGYLGMLTGCAILAFGQCDGWLDTYSGFFHWWYGGTATDARTAQMQKILQKKQEVQRLQHVRNQMSGFIQSRYQPNLA